jgi:hypothetical protein
MNDSDLNGRSCVKATKCLIAVLRSERTYCGVDDLDISFVWDGGKKNILYNVDYGLTLIL